MRKSKANTSRIVKKANIFLVLSLLRATAEVTIEDIILRTGLSRPTVLSIVKELSEKGLVEKCGYLETEVGRMPAKYALVRNLRFAVGIDVDGPPVYFAISDLSGNLCSSRKIEIPDDSDIQTIRATISQTVLDMLKELSIERDQVIGIGMGLPASVDIGSNSAFLISRLKALAHHNIAHLIHEDTGIHAYVRNDAHLIGFAEQKLIQPKISSFLCVLHRTGIGMSVMFEDQLYSGQSGNAGFIGHTTINETGPICECGRKGCLEAYSSKRAIQQHYEQLTHQKKNYEEILGSALNNDLHAQEAVRAAGFYYGIGIANAVKHFDIDTIVISDIRCGSDHPFFKSIEKSFQDAIKPYFNRSYQILPGVLSDANLALGGCMYVLDRFFESPELVLQVE